MSFLKWKKPDSIAPKQYSNGNSIIIPILHSKGPLKSIMEQLEGMGWGLPVQVLTCPSTRKILLELTSSNLVLILPYHFFFHANPIKRKQETKK